MTSTFFWGDNMAYKYDERGLLSLSHLEPNKFNPNIMPKETFDALVQDMKTSGPKHVLAVDRLIVSPKNVFYNDPKAEADKYVIIDGEWRFKAAAIAGWKSIKCEIRNIGEDIARALNYRRNKERGNIDPLKEAALFKSEIDKGLTQEMVALKYNVSRPYVGNRLGLIQLDEKVVKIYRQPEESFKKAKVEEYEETHKKWETLQKQPGYEYLAHREPEEPPEEDLVPRGTISPSHLEAISTLPREKQAEIARDILEQDMTVRATERMVTRTKRDIAREKRFKAALEKAKRKKCPECGSDPEGFAHGDETKFRCSSQTQRYCYNSWEFMKTAKEVAAEKAREKTVAHKEMVKRMQEGRKNPRYIRTLETPDELHLKVAPWVLRKVQELTEISRVSIYGKRGNEVADISYASPEAARHNMNLSFRVGKLGFGFIVQAKDYKKFDAKARVDMWGMEPSEETREALRHFFSKTVNTNNDPKSKVKPKPKPISAERFSLKAHVEENPQ